MHKAPSISGIRRKGPAGPLRTNFLANGVAKGTPECKDRLGFGVTDSHAKGFQDLKKYDNAVEELLKFVK